MEELFTWQSLTTYAGSVLATTTITQFLKELGALKRLPTRVLSYAVATAILLLATGFTVGLTVSRLVLCPINAAMVSLASNGAFDALNASHLKKPEL